MLIYRSRILAAMLAFFALATAGCNKAVNADMAYKAAINDHFKAYPVCLWSQPKKFPVQAATSDDAKTEGYDALTQEGLLTRTTAEKKIVIISKAVDLDARHLAARLWKLLLWKSRGDVNRQLDAGHERQRRKDDFGCLSLQDRECAGVGEFPVHQDGIPDSGRRARIQSFRHGHAGADWRPLGIHEVGRFTLLISHPHREDGFSVGRTKHTPALAVQRLMAPDTGCSCVWVLLKLNYHKSIDRKLQSQRVVRQRRRLRGGQL
jgi:hypothetical protein